jgi:tetratricopeptide (TPR) repeat protein
MLRRSLILKERIGFLAIMFFLFAGSAGYSQPIENYNNNGLKKAQEGNFDGAILDFSKTIEADPNDSNAFTYRGSVKGKKGDYDGAMADLNKAIEINPKDATAYSNRGSVRHFIGDDEGAIVDYTKAIEINPKDAGAYAYLGGLKGKKGDYDGAMADLNKAIEINPKFTAAYNNLGLIKIDKGDYDGAITDLTKAIEIEPKDAYAHYNLGIAFDQKGNEKDSLDSLSAIIEYGKTVELDPDNPEYVKAYYRLGDIAGGQGEYDQAIVYCDKAIKLNPKYPEAFGLRGACYYYKKEYEKAREDIKKAESLGMKPKPEFIEMLKKDSGREK